MNGWKLSGDVPLRVGQTCALTVTLPNQESIFVDAAIMRWVGEQEYGLETLVVDKPTQSRVELIVQPLEQVAPWSALYEKRLLHTQIMSCLWVA